QEGKLAHLIGSAPEGTLLVEWAWTGLDGVHNVRSPFREGRFVFPFWNIAIAPALSAVRAKRVVEIGAFRGDTTVLLLEHLGSRGELHVIDPMPKFDATREQRWFEGRFVLHRDTSHNVLPL